MMLRDETERRQFWIGVASNITAGLLIGLLAVIVGGRLKR